MSRITCPALHSKVTTAEDAALLIRPADNVGFSGFTGAGYPKVVPRALADRINEAHLRGDKFQIGLWTGASTAPDADGILAEARAVSTRLPYNSDPTMRTLINAGEVDYVDEHLSHSAQHMWFGFYGNLDVAVVEVTAILTDARSSSPSRCSGSASPICASTRTRSSRLSRRIILTAMRRSLPLTRRQPR